MSTFQYNGEDERVIATLGITVQQGDTFEAPEDFNAYGFSLVTNNKKSTAQAVAITPSDIADPTVDEVK